MAQLKLIIQITFDRILKIQAMKKIISVLFCVCMVGGIYAQSFVVPKFGRSAATVSGNSEYGEISGINGWVAGIGLSSGKPLSLNSELLFFQKGATLTSPEGYWWEQVNNYLEFPNYLKLRIPLGPINLFANGGAYVSYWLSGKSRFTEDGVIVSESYTFDSDDSDGVKDNRLDYGLLGGVGVELSLGSGRLMAEFRYEAGLADINSVKDKPEYYQSTKNQAFSLVVGFMFGQ
ncbi:MAG: hypothetical protein PWR12_1634 [Eubacteriaceae bacterium]|jgi:hypothetical protein|nr:hypothetical protein [Eubacteriaceae bacterium]